MGYTHYWTQPRDHTWSEWFDIAIAVRRIVDQSMKQGILVRMMVGVDPESEMTVSGVGVEACESLYVSRLRNDDSFGPAGSNFCKTARYRYDTTVTAILAFLSAYHGYEVSSDGDVLDWSEGVTLASVALDLPIPNPMFVKELTQ